MSGRRRQGASLANRLGLVLGVASLLTSVLVTSVCAEEPRVVAVEPTRSHDLLLCRLSTRGLPGERLLSTLHSGLTSAVDLDLALLDGRGRAVAGNLVTLRLTYDLWGEEFTITNGGDTVHLPDDAALTDWMATPPLLPVAPLKAIAGTGPHRIRAALRLHVIAPEAREQAESLVAGPDGQEVSVGIGSLIRLFYRGDKSGTADTGAMVSLPFHPGDLVDAPD